MDDKQKRKYILRRVPKLQALAFVLLRYGMNIELNELNRQWQSIGGRFDQYGHFAIHDQSHDLMDTTRTKIGDITGE